MKKPVVPAILTDNKNALTNMVKKCRNFCDYVQIDIMDGKFVSSRSVTMEDLDELALGIENEAHLMVENPLEWLPVFKKLESRKIIYHFEIKKDHSAIIREIKKQGFKVGLAINPSTKIKDFILLIDKLDSILFMAVIPGFYGSEFVPEVLRKITEFKKLYPEKYVGIDGGVNTKNIKEVARSGVDYVCVGSAILKASAPEIAYKNIARLLNE